MALLVALRTNNRLPPVAAVYQRQLSVPSLLGQLMSTSESWGVNGHTMRYNSPVSVVLVTASAGVRLRATGNRDQHRPMGLEARERTLLFYVLSGSEEFRQL